MFLFLFFFSSRRRHTRSLRDWSSDVCSSDLAYLGLSVPAFPNMFLLYGPNTNGGTGSVVFIVEAGMTHVLAALAEMKRTGTRRSEERRVGKECRSRGRWYHCREQTYDMNAIV